MATSTRRLPVGRRRAPPRRDARTLAVLVVEAIGGWLTNSVALLATPVTC